MFDLSSLRAGSISRPDTRAEKLLPAEVEMNITAPAIGVLFISLGAIFLGLAVRDYVKKGATSTPARKAWLRIGVLFTGVGIFLYVFHTYFQPRLK